jgi:hypothetical protein
VNDATKDIGHERLVSDLRDLLALAEAYAFHDFLNTQFATPKMALDVRLRVMVNNVRNGHYDNPGKEE